MSFQKKYWYTFKDLKNSQYTVEIWQDTTNTITPEEIRGDLNPFLIQYSDVTKFDVVRGSGCELNLLSETDRQFFNLYTADMMEFQIRVYKGANLIWLGYLDSELYVEPFNEIKNYPVKFSGTDGFALLERMNYLDENGNKYYGLVTQFSIIKNIISKLNLGYNNIYISLSTTSNNFSISSNETIFHKTYCNNQNWYNEDGDAETCRDVLEYILKPYGAYIIQDNANLYIIDVNTVAKNTTTSFKKYDSSFNYVSTDDLNLNLGDISTIKFADSNQQLNVVSGFNKQLIKYSPYVDQQLLKYDQETFSGSVTETNFGFLNDTWTRKYYETSEHWNKLNTVGKFVEMVGTGDNASSMPEKYLVITPIATAQQNHNNIFEYSKSLPDIVFSTNKQFYIKVDCSCYVRTIEEKSSVTPTIKVSQVKLKTNLTIGNKRYRYDADFGSSKGWYPVEQPQHHTVLSFTNLIETANNIYSMSTINDTWTNTSVGYIDVVSTGGNSYTTQTRKPDPLYIPIPLNSAVVGNNISFSIGDYKVYDNSANRNEITTTIQDLRIKDIKLTIVDENFNELTKKDIEYIGYMNSKYKNEGNTITLYQGSSVENSPIEKGSLMGYNSNYYYLNSWSREGKMDILENLLLRSIESNYTNKTIELTATINKLNSIVGCLTYQSFLPNKVFMVVGCEQNLSENTSTVRLQEISIDNLDIYTGTGWE